MDTLYNIPVELFDTLYSAFDEGILILDSERDICYINKITKSWLQAFEDEIIGNHIPESLGISESNYAIVDRKSIEIVMVSPEELPTVLLALHDDINKTIVRIKRKKH